MWAQACDVLDQADRMQRQFFRLVVAGRAPAVWEPPIDVYEDNRQVVVVIALPGVPAECLEIINEERALVIRAERRIPFANSGRTVRRIEIPYGYFERRIELPEAGLERGSQELIDGCLILTLWKKRRL